MKNTILSALSFLVVFTAHAQCFTIESVEWDVEQFTLNGTIDATYTMASLPTGILLINSESATFSLSMPIEKANDSFTFFLMNGAEECHMNFDPDESTYFNADWVTVDDPSTCDATDGSLCLTDYTGNSIDFTIDGFASANGCLGGLSSGSHFLSPAPISGEDGVTYLNPSKSVELLELNVTLVEQDGLLVPQITGGSGDYVWFINDAPVNEGITSQFKGCAVVDVTDMVTGCKALKTEYLTNSIKGDLSGGATQSGSDGCVLTSDLLAVLSFLGPESTAADFDCDGITGITDLLFFLTRFGAGDCGS